ncbi:hypothetical protein [Methylobacterium sp. J-076]|uniref:hypothetical protein n=1 Tax=Methylobacterium sp. J-076 TaxID=2836655 RepID=UPI001FB97EA1|nr:hypothetical protein [Methylobacterium sp. J-076]MCJ2015655.1 hypothetical protein [Methylobacterium sp. J-076]
MTQQHGQDDGADLVADLEAGRIALEMLDAARATGDTLMIACAEMVAYAAGLRLAARLTDDRSE